MAMLFISSLSDVYYQMVTCAVNISGTCFQSLPTTNQWIQVDLGHIYDIHVVFILARKYTIVFLSREHSIIFIFMSLLPYIEKVH